MTFPARKKGIDLQISSKTPVCGPEFKGSEIAAIKARIGTTNWSHCKKVLIPQERLREPNWSKGEFAVRIDPTTVVDSVCGDGMNKHPGAIARGRRRAEYSLSRACAGHAST